MIAPFLIPLLLAYPIGPVARHKVGPLSFELPVTWREGSRSEGIEFDSGEGGASLFINVSPVERQGMAATECLDIVLKRLAAGPEWHKRKLDTFETAYVSAYERTANNSTSVRVDRLVGCDGKVAWSMIFFLDLSYTGYYGFVVSNVQDSLRSADYNPEGRNATRPVDRSREPPP